MIRPGDLKTPEDDFDIETRRRDTVPAPPGRPGPTAELRTLRERIAACRECPTPPQPNVDPYGRDWWKRGWAAGYAAAIEAIEKD